MPSLVGSEMCISDRYWCCSTFTAAAAVPGALAAALYCWSATKIMPGTVPVEFYVWWDCDIKMGLFCDVRVKYLYEKSTRKIFTGYVLNWAGKWKWWLRKIKYIREPLSVKFPEKSNCLEIGIWYQLIAAIRQQLTTKGKECIRQIYSNDYHIKKRVVRYDCLPIRGTQYLTSCLLYTSPSPRD